MRTMADLTSAMSRLQTLLSSKSKGVSEHYAVGRCGRDLTGNIPGRSALTSHRLDDRTLAIANLDTSASRQSVRQW
jgi:hypothetical protein